MGYMLLPRELPRYETIRQQAARYPQMDPRSIESFLVLLRTATDTIDACDAYLARRGISQGRFRVLMLLNRHPEQSLNPSDLAEKCGVTRATMTGLLDGLERDNYVTREGDVTDRRRALVSLTPTARTFLDGFLPDFFAHIAHLMGELQESEKVELTHLLERVATRLPSFLGGVSSFVCAEDSPEPP
jgi:DNA-binding MarR family transcriptional regulator